MIHANLKGTAFNCTYDRSMLSISIALDSHIVSLNYSFNYAKQIGRFRIRLHGKEHETSDKSGKYQYHVRELGFIQLFLINNHTLASDPTVQLSLMRIINKTQPLDNFNPCKFTATWAPHSIASVSNLFLAFDE
jgi:hypothetical protein